MTALEEIKKALEEVTPERVERLWWFLHILAKSTGTTNAEDDKWNWINAFCTDYEDDTFNLAAKLGFITVRHDSFMETSTARITKAGMALVAHFDKAPSAALTSTLESLQREIEELRQRGDGAANMARQMAVDCSNAQKNIAELRSAMGPINALLAHLLSMSVYHITNPPTADWEFVQVCNGDLRKMIELSDAAEYALASTGGEHNGN